MTMPGPPSNVDAPRHQHQVFVPPEIVQKIFVEAWISFEWRLENPYKERRDCWQLYHTVSLVSKQYRACMVRTAMTHLYLTTPPEVTYYADLVQKYARHSSGGWEDRDIVVTAPFYVYINMSIGAHVDSGEQDESYKDSISKVVAFLAMSESPSLWLDDWHDRPWGTAWPFSLLPSIARLQLSSNIRRTEARLDPAITYPSITHLHMDDNPSRTLSETPRFGQDLTKFLRHFPRVTHFRLSINCSIVPLIGALPCLEVLELEAGPWLGGSSSSIRHLFIASTVRKGLFARRGATPRKVIRVYTGKGEMDIWEPTLRTCTEHGVALERVPVADDLPLRAHTRLGMGLPRLALGGGQATGGDKL